MGNGNDLRPKNFHSGYVGGLLCNIHLAHVNLTVQTEESGGRRKGNTVLSGAGFCD